jgi:hypothetical protein
MISLSDVVLQVVQYSQHNVCDTFSDSRDTTVTKIRDRS